jgi:glucose-6-phosphate isomerase
MLDNWNGPLPEPDIRTVAEMRAVLAAPDCNAPDDPLYFMYRDLAMTQTDRSWLEANGIRFDITVIPPANICGECVKTKGHYHPPSPGGPGYPELYQVMAGTAHYLLQHRMLTEAVVVTAYKGEMVLIPPDFGHITINPTEEQLVMANLVSRHFSSEYAFYEQNRGGMYYELGPGEWVPNSCYSHIPPLRFTGPYEVPDLGVKHQTPLYGLVERRTSLDFLVHPERFPEQLGFQRTE